MVVTYSDHEGKGMDELFYAAKELQRKEVPFVLDLVGFFEDEYKRKRLISWWMQGSQYSMDSKKIRDHIMPWPTVSCSQVIMRECQMYF